MTAVFMACREGYIGFVEALPGANTQGATLDETRRNLKEAVQIVLEANRELGVHDRAMEARRLLNFEMQHMDRYSRLSQDNFDAILISADPASIDSRRRVRSIFAWESADRQSFGSIWFGDS